MALSEEQLQKLREKAAQNEDSGTVSSNEENPVPPDGGKQKVQVCRYCKTKIPADAVVCPNCGKRLYGGCPMWFPVIFTVAAACILLFVFVSHFDEVSTGSTYSYDITYVRSYTYTGLLGGTRDYILVQVENTGSGRLSLDGASFTFKDADGNIIGVDTGDYVETIPFILLPGETGYIVQNAGYITGSMDAESDYEIITDLMINPTTDYPRDCEILDVSLAEGSIFTKVLGRIQYSESGDSYVNIGIVFFDDSGLPLVGCVAWTDRLAAGETQSFEGDLTGLSSLDVEIDVNTPYEVYAY